MSYHPRLDADFRNRYLAILYGQFGKWVVWSDYFPAVDALELATSCRDAREYWRRLGFGIETRGRGRAGARLTSAPLLQYARMAGAMHARHADDRQQLCLL
jgi:hypothetical protein